LLPSQTSALEDVFACACPSNAGAGGFYLPPSQVVAAGERPSPLQLPLPLAVSGDLLTSVVAWTSCGAALAGGTWGAVFSSLGSSSGTGLSPC